MINLSNKAGFTLAEAVISSFLVILVLGGAYALVSQSSSLIYSARNHYIAINISRARIERIRTFPYDQIQSFTETDVVVDDSGTPTTEGYFRRTTTVNTNYQAGLTMVQVQTDIRNQKTLTFKGEKESVASLFTEYLTQ